MIGARPFEFIPREYGRPIVVSGFEPLDVLQSIQMLLAQLAEGRCEVEMQYRRVVSWEGNARAREAMDEVFTTREHFEWRGLGSIPRQRAGHVGGVRGARRRAPLRAAGRGASRTRASASAARCCKGVIKPWECRVFGTACTPERPIGTCMVSPEGACAAYYSYGRYARERETAVWKVGAATREQRIREIVQSTRSRSPPVSATSASRWPTAPGASRRSR